ncbi:MAG: transporter substrate-binding domain-containing protein [Hyphomicrobiales bacterium]
MKSRIFSMKRAALSLLTGVSLVVTGFSVATAADMPAVPDAIQKVGKVRVGTKCDYPPEGFLDNAGVPLGVEVAMAHQIAKYAFGEDAEAEIVCVTSANRVPALLGNKIDIIIATMGINPERAKVVDFTQPYAWSSSGVAVRVDTDYNTLDELKDKPIAFVKGAWQIPYFETNYPGIKPLLLDGVSDSLQALMQGRVEAYAHDTPVLLTLTSKNNKIRLIDESYKIGLRGAAVRPGESDWVAFLNASLDQMAEDGKFNEWLKTYVDADIFDVKSIFWDMSKKPAQ